MSFKTKNRKKVPTDNRVTLDAKYKEKEEYFKKLQDLIPKKKKNLNKIKKQYFELFNKNPELSTDEFEKMMSRTSLIDTLFHISCFDKSKEVKRWATSAILNMY